MKKLLKLAFVVGGVAAVAKLIAAKKGDWQGMAESDVRAKLDARLPSKVPADKRAEIADKIVGKMRERGALIEDASAGEASSDGQT